MNPISFNKNYYNIYRKNYQNSVESKQNTELQEQFDNGNITDYKTSELGMKAQAYFNRHIDYEFTLHRSLYSKDGPVIGIMSKYNEFLDNINRTFEDINERKKEIEDLDKIFEGVITFYSASQTLLLKCIGRMDSEFKQIGSIDNQTGENMKKDMINMFRNAKNYYKQTGSIDGISESEITGNSKTLNYKDLLLFDKTSSMVNAFIYNEVINYKDDKTFIKNGEKIVERIKNTNHSDYMKNIFINILSLKY
jgi:hypothetical protein